MLRRAVGSQSNPAGSKPSGLQPLRMNHTAVNAPRPAEPNNNKRKFERTMSTNSNLGALHENVYFNENDFDDDLTIDLTGSPPSSGLPPVKYPQMGPPSQNVTYPTLPPAPKEKPQEAPSNSAPIPWSSSPPEPPRASKRRTVPWLDVETKPKQETFTPLPKDKPQEKYPWNKTASVLRHEQKALRQRNKDRQQQKQPAFAKKTSNGKNVATTFLSEEQRQIIEIVNKGASVFFTGSAGTGKSVLMRAIIAKLRDFYSKEPDRVAVTASTGLAACNIEGITLHSFAGIGLGKEAAPELVKKIRRNQKLKQRWQRTKVLIIDEISMVDGDLFDKLEQIARSLRNNGMPFGGIQLVVTGDFFQLPPVPEKNSIAKFAFDAGTWNTTIQHTILLTHVFRQKDPVFANMLNEMRLGKLTPQSIRAFQSLNRPMKHNDEVEATEL
jgi:ATP-dependent DNA helicase PIF1